VLLVSLLFLGVTAVAGAIGLLVGAIAPPVEMLAGSPFRDYTVPGAALMMVGGLALAGAHAVRRRRPWARALAAVAGVAIVVFEMVEIGVVGSEPGVARNLQTLYVGVGTVILGAVFVLLASGTHARAGAAPPRRYGRGIIPAPQSLEPPHASRNDIPSRRRRP
jgi:peptidoglycan/LPS O-acetylase OafA/YrhL